MTRRVSSVGLGVLVVLTALTSISASSVSPPEPVVDGDSYNAAMSQQARDLSDLCAIFQNEQYSWLPLSFPGSGILEQTASSYPQPFDPTKFPPEFVAGLVPVEIDGVNMAPVLATEDPATRDYVFYSQSGQQIYSVPPSQGYDWKANVRNALPAQFASADTERLDSLYEMYDPAKIKIIFYLILPQDLVAYCTAPPETEDTSASLAAASLNRSMLMSPLNTMTPLLGWNGSNIQFTAIGAVSNGIQMIIAYPPGVSNLDIFVTTDIVGYWWNLVLTTNNLNTSTNWFSWVDTSTVRTNACPVFYTAGNPDIDSDQDGLPDDREKFLYHTSSATNDTDGDGISDYDEIMVYHTDPNNPDTTKPTVVIAFPTQGAGRVWLP